MNEPTIVFYGTPGHAPLELLYDSARARASCRVAWLIQEDFPLRLDLCMSVGGDEQPGFLIAPSQEPIALDDIVSVCLDRYYVDATKLQEFEPRDVEYIQTECWATLIALFAQLGEHAVVANHVTQRDHLASRLGELCYLSSHGLEVPRALITSDDGEARRFYEAQNKRVILKPVSSHKAFRVMTDDDLARLDIVQNAPVHFEEAPVGAVHSCVVVGDRELVVPAADVPVEILNRCGQACRALGLTIGEVNLRHTDRWVASGLHYFPTRGALEHPEVLDATMALLENRAAWEPVS